MKKLSLLLALLMVATCCMLASCGGDEESSAATSSVATSSATASSEAESSVASSSEEASSEAESSEEASSEEASSEEASSEAESSEDPGFEKNPDALPTEGENVALNKTYTVSEQYRQGGADVNWAYDENADIAYPDNGTELTDGTAPTAEDGYNVDGWSGFSANTPAQGTRGYAYVNVDLEEIYEVAAIDVTLLIDSATGISAPTWFGIAVSEDGETFTDVGDAPVELTEDGVHVVTIEVDATARYVQVQFNGGTWNFIGEIAVK